MSQVENGETSYLIIVSEPASLGGLLHSHTRHLVVVLRHQKGGITLSACTEISSSNNDFPSSPVYRNMGDDIDETASER